MDASTSPANYRPTSILCILSKLLEKHAPGLLVHHFSINGVLSPCQWIFTEKSLLPLLFFPLFMTFLLLWTQVMMFALFSMTSAKH